MEEKIKKLKEKFEGSNKYMMTLSYEDIKELFAIIEVLKNKEPIFLIKDLYTSKLKEVTLQDVEGLIEQGRKEMKDKIKYKIEKYRCFCWYNSDDEFWAKVMLDGFELLLEKENKK